ncbi:MAG: cryptochrome/photolyase family protein [Alphaproteobacteria bacterium]
MGASPVILWFRQDLRLQDHLPLQEACHMKRPSLAVFIEDPGFPAGAASRWWRFHALQDLENQLAHLGIRLIIRQGDSLQHLAQLMQRTQAKHLFFHRRYTPAGQAQDKLIHQHFEKKGCCVKTYPGFLLAEPWEIANQKGEPYQIFTPFWKALERHLSFQTPVLSEAPKAISPYAHQGDLESVSLMALFKEPAWAGSLGAFWKISEAAAHAHLNNFLYKPVETYQQDRDIPHLAGTSLLSPYLHLGQISINRLYAETRKASLQTRSLRDGFETFLKELGWRDFSYHLLHQFPTLKTQPFRQKFEKFPWKENTAWLEKWQTGQTGYPLVDAGMRQLWKLGWMHNRVRMITASFLVKHLLIPWQQGEAWFWDTLVDADPASNPANWQWVAGCGADAAPYIRIFNPLSQGEKFDPEGRYIKTFVPELKDLPAPWVHRPFEAPSFLLAQSGIELGKTYPFPLVMHDKARQQALQFYQTFTVDAR